MVNPPMEMEITTVTVCVSDARGKVLRQFTVCSSSTDEVEEIAERVEQACEADDDLVVADDT